MPCQITENPAETRAVSGGLDLFPLFMAISMTSLPKSPPHVHPRTNPISFHLSPVFLSLRFCRIASLLHPRLCALRTGADGDELLSPRKDVAGILEVDKGSDRNGDYEVDSEDERWVDWEDQILEDTVPLVGFVRMILHPGKYESGDRLNPEHEKTILEKPLPFHPDSEKKIGCGIDYITIGYHPSFERPRCLFVARKDGEVVDFSYWKCIKGLIRKNYPLYADGFIL